MSSAEIDIEDHVKLLRYLRAAGRIGAQEWPEFHTLAGGVSNRTVRVTRPGDAGRWVLKQALPRLRVPSEWRCDPARIEREATGMRWLAELAPPGTIPRLVFEDRANNLLAMEAVPEPHDNWKSLLLAGRVEPEHIDQFARLLAEVHRRSRQRADELRPIFEETRFFEALRIEPYYLYTATEVPAAARFLHELVHDVRGHRIAIVHGDYSPKNILVHAGRLVLLDHEVIHFGDPAFDLGFSMAHFLSKAHHLPALRRVFLDAARRYWRVYAAAAEADDALKKRAVRHSLGCTLARAAGRSPLEYLTAKERRRQVAVVCDILRDVPGRMDRLLDAFAAKVA